MDAHEAIGIIRELAADSGNVIILRHCRERMEQRGITIRQILQCLRKGTIQEGPFLNDHCSWQVTMARHAAGDEISCVVAIEGNLIVITTF